MSVDPNELFALPDDEKLRLVEMLWDNLGESTKPIPLPDWIDREGLRRRDEMQSDLLLGFDHEETWKRIERRHG